ncbi:hypothetical protein AKJ16_DCAP22087 [Drosera capensis]
MLGRLRVLPSSPSEIFEAEERSPLAKIFKQDSLSIYEATLLKLKEGSQRSQSSPDEGFADGTASSSLSTISVESSEQNLSSGVENGMVLDEPLVGSSDSSRSLGVLSSQNEGELLAIGDCSTGSVSPGLSSGKCNGRNLSIAYLFSQVQKFKSGTKLKL